jgi:hypothetical protein
VDWVHGGRRAWVHGGPARDANEGRGGVSVAHQSSGSLVLADSEGLTRA